MTMVPLQALFRGDCLAILVQVDDRDTMDVVARKVAHHVIHRRLPSQDAPMRVQCHERVLPTDLTVAEAGLSPMSIVEVFYDERERAGMDRRSDPR